MLLKVVVAAWDTAGRDIRLLSHVVSGKMLFRVIIKMWKQDVMDKWTWELHMI